MPNRIIKESIHLSDTVNQMTDFQFRLWVNLITYVDDYGRGDARPAVIKGMCFPLRNRISCADVEKALQALAGIGCISLYDVDGKSYLCFPTWESHQNIRSKKSRFPGPEDACKQMQTSASRCKQMQANVTENPIQSESNPNPNAGNARARKREAFTPPTITEVSDYCREKGYNIDAERFVDYYSRQGWKLSNGQPMKDWPSAVRLWGRDKKNNHGTYQTDPNEVKIAYESLLAEAEGC